MVEISRLLCSGLCRYSVLDCQENDHNYYACKSREIGISGKFLIDALRANFNGQFIAMLLDYDLNKTFDMPRRQNKLAKLALQKCVIVIRDS